MALEAGDILIFSKQFGHVALVYDSKTVVHAQYSGNFHKDLLETQSGNTFSHFSQNAMVYKFPWDKYGEGSKAGYQQKIQAIADRMMGTAAYGVTRAIRLKAGDSTYGPKAHARLTKYRERLAKGSDKFVSTVTCSEAAILCFQLTFLEKGGPGFIMLDAAHTMPNTLAKWLHANWGEPRRG